MPHQNSCLMNCRVKFVAPTSSDEGQYLISLVVPEAKTQKIRPQADKQPLQIIPIRTTEVKAKKAKEVIKVTKEAERPSTTILDGKEVLVPAEAMVEREAMAIFRDDDDKKCHKMARIKRIFMA